MSVNLMFVLNKANQVAEAESQKAEAQKRKYGRNRKLIWPKLREVVKPDKTVKLTMNIPKANGYDYSVMSFSTWVNLQKTKVRKIIKPDGSHYFIVAPKTKKHKVPFLRISSAGDVLVHDKGQMMKYNHQYLPLFYGKIVKSVEKLNRQLFPLSKLEENLSSFKFFNRIGKFFRRLIKK